MRTPGQAVLEFLESFAWRPAITWKAFSPKRATITPPTASPVPFELADPAPRLAADDDVGDVPSSTGVPSRLPRPTAPGQILESPRR
jgi:hypothetical protein